MTNYTLNETKMFADVTDGIAIIINSETGIYYGMNGLGSCVYENLTAGSSVEDIMTAFEKMNAPESVKSNLDEFIKVMLEKEILEETTGGSRAAEIDETTAKEDDFFMSIKEYSDAQELLLADPIHEVKEETGWTPEKDSIGYTKEETKEREKKLEE